MLVPNRFESVEDYKYGFNGKEKDDEVKGEGNSYDFGARLYDARVGRWFKTDPLFREYPYDSPFMFSGDSPISIIDPDGKRKRKITLIYDESGNLVDSQVKIVDYTLIEKKVYTRDKITFLGYVIADNLTVKYDYYDSADIEVAVRDKNGKIYGHTIIQENVLADKRIEAVHPLLADMSENWTNIDDKKLDEGKSGSSLDGSAKGHFKGGIDFYLNDNGSILNVRGLEKMNSGSIVEKVEVSEIMAIGSNQASMTSKVPFMKTSLGHIHDGGKAPDLIHTTLQNIKNALGNSKSDKNKDNQIKYFGKVCNQCDQLLSKEEESTHQTLGQGTRDSISTNPKR